MIIRKTDSSGIRITKIEGQDLPLDVKNNVAGVAAEALLKAHPVEFGFEIEIYKNIKAGSGIGSSAASSAGAVFFQFGVRSVERSSREGVNNSLLKIGGACQRNSLRSFDHNAMTPGRSGGIFRL